jgi:hypothetical protein
VFWGSCVVFWCSFWVGFWLSESLRGVFTPARNGRLQGARSPRPAKSLPPVGDRDPYRFEVAREALSQLDAGCQ